MADMRTNIKLLIDTDIGTDIDDALALLLLLHQPGVEIVGVTTVYGCADLRAKVAHKILRAAGCDAPVVAGASIPMKSPRPVWVTGTEGRGVLAEEEMEAPLEDFEIGTDAARFIRDTLLRHPGEITVLALGALTNLARSIEMEPGTAGCAKSIYFMGGGITYPRPLPRDVGDRGKFIATPSHNVACDLKAARIVFASDARIHLATNDVSTTLWWDGPQVQEVMNAQSPPECAIVGRMLRVWLDHRSHIFRQPVTGTCPHDPLTAAEALGYGFVDYWTGQVEVLCDGSTKFRPELSGKHHAGAIVDGERFLQWFGPLLLSPAKSTIFRSTNLQ